MVLRSGDPAPSITAPNQHGETVQPDFTDVTVVYFYVEDGTPGCTTQAEQFMREIDMYRQAGVEIYGISTDSVADHREFATDHDIEYDLLADPDGTVCEAFDVERDHAGRPVRTTFVLADEQVIRTDEGVSPDGHARDLLLDLHADGIVNLDI